MLAGLRVLFVEDEFLIALDGEEMLRNLGIGAITRAANFEAAKVCAQGGDYDVAILDLNLNGTLSTPVAQQLVARGIPVIFASGYEVTHESFGDVDAVFLVKPYCLRKLQDAITAALGKGLGRANNGDSPR
jgi:CheY-like chemotaxis protein